VKFLRRKSANAKKRPALLPATLLLMFLALVGGTVTWLELSSAGHGPAARHSASPAKPHAAAPAEHAAPAPHAPASHTPAPAPAPAPAPQGHAAAEPPAAHAEAAPSPHEHEKPAQPAPAQPAAETPAAEIVSPPAAPPQLRLPRARTGPPLPAAPDPALVEQSPNGPLPRVGLDGREPWRVYARPFDAKDSRPRIAVVVHGLGVSNTVTRAAINGLPAGVTLGFSPYADGVSGWMRQARAAGHETLMLIPIEPENYPVSDPGPRALMTSLSAGENVERLGWLLSRGTGYAGVATYMGSRYASSRRHVRVLLEALKKRGLMLLDAGQGSNSVLLEIAGQTSLPFAIGALFVDRKLSTADIDARLEELESRARQGGRVIAMARPYPVTIERLAAWAAKVESRGFVLVPVTALAERVRPS
jgi:polysaccharide deacetylase 2 family uncharacterized protein YibQ